MNITTTIMATVEADHTIQVPATLPVGERVMIVRMPSIEVLLRDPERRTRFAATRVAIDAAVQRKTPPSLLSDEEIVTLVKRARRSNRKS